MKKVACLLVSSLALLVGCGSSGGDAADPFGPEPDFAAIEAHFDHPDGTLKSGNASAILGQTSQDTGGLYSPTSSSSTSPGGTTTKALHVLGGSSPFASCQGLLAGQRSGSCACPDGGSIAWDIAGDRSGGTMRFRANACSAGGSTADGSEFIRFAVGKDANGVTTSSMLLVAHLTVARGAETHTIDLEEQLAAGKIELSVKVDDGWVVLSFQRTGDGQNGTFTVRDRNGTWTCVVENGKGTCTGDRGGEPVTFGG